jgi:Flp pilus assembly protein TadG
MIVKLIRDDTWGASLVEFSVTFPLFLLLMFGLVQVGLLLFTQAGLQHGVEVAARCASVNYAANQVGLNQSCFAVAPNTVTNTTIQQYAAQNSWGIVPSSSSFTVTPPTGGGLCGTNKRYVVTVTHTYNLINYIFSVPLTAASCFPISLS